MDWSILAEIIKVLAGIVAVFGAPLAYVTYRRSVRTKRAEWLVSLHEKFFETDRYAQIRRILDYRPEPEYAELVRAVAVGAHHPLVDELYRYLNFFELLASLRQLGQISDEEIVGLFDYDLRLLKHHPFILETLVPQGFERLSELLRTARLLPPR
ncbi:MAG: hypothetical protein ACREON_06845 [Gemmatimonadaceae bacterium]